MKYKLPPLNYSAFFGKILEAGRKLFCFKNICSTGGKVLGSSRVIAFCNKFKLPQTAENPTVGLDIGPKEIRIAEGETVVSIPTPEGSVLDGVIVEKNKVVEAIKDLFASRSITSKNVVIAVSGGGILLRLMNVPPMGPEGIKDIIKNEASNYLVFAGSNLVTDFYSLGETSQEGDKRLKILSVVVKKEIIDSYLETVKSAELNLQAIDISSLSLARAVFSQGLLSQGIVVLAAVEHDRATTFIFKDGGIHYLHSVDSVDDLNSEVESIVSYCRSEFGKSVKIKKIISTKLEGVSVAKGLALRAKEGDKFPVKIDLLPLEEIRTKEFNRQVLNFLKVLGGLSAVMVLWFFFLRFQTHLAFRDVAGIQDAFRKPTPVLDKLLEVERMSKMYRVEMKKQQNIILKVAKETWPEIFEEIKRIIPKKAFLLSIKNDADNTVVFTGRAIDQSSVFDFIHSLGGSVYFEDIELKETKDIETGNGMRSHFVIKCRIGS